MPRVRIDRIEGELVVLECDGRSVDVPRALVPAEAREGDVLSIVVDRDATDAARRDVSAKRARLSQNDDGGDFSL